MLTYTCYNIQFYFYTLIQPLTNMHMYIDNYSAYWGGGGLFIYLFVCLCVWMVQSLADTCYMNTQKIVHMIIKS